MTDTAQSEPLPVLESIADSTIPPSLETADSEPPSLFSYHATYFLIAINVAVFALMFHASPAVQLFKQHEWWHALTAQFDGNTLIRFGASDSGNILGQGEWWRLLTSIFVHVTILHLVINMWCLWNLGLFGEPLLGKQGLFCVYIVTGWAGMMLSLGVSAFTRQPVLVAGASGAVYGVAGILIVLLSNRKLSTPWEELRSLRLLVVAFSLINLLVGIVPNFVPANTQISFRQLHVDLNSMPRVDNSAHLGGFICGLLLGFPLFPRMTSGKTSYRARQRTVYAVAAFVLCLIGYGISRSVR